MIVAIHRTIVDFAIPEQRPDIFCIALFRLLDGRFHVDLHHEVDTPSKVKTEIHRARPNPPEPIRGCRRQIECHRIAILKGGS